MQDRADPHARGRAFDIARQGLPTRRLAVPTHLSTASAPTPRVNWFTRSMPSGPRPTTMSAAPNSLARACRDLWRLIAMMRSAPISLAASTPMRPTARRRRPRPSSPASRPRRPPRTSRSRVHHGRDVDARHRLEERPQTRGARELTEEEQRRRQHAGPHPRTAEHLERRGRARLLPFGHLRKRDELPNKDQRRDRHHAEERAAPPNVLTEKAAEGRGDRSHEDVAALRSSSARGTFVAGTIRIMVAADIGQKPPMATPMSARPTMNTG